MTTRLVVGMFTPAIRATPVTPRAPPVGRGLLVLAWPGLMIGIAGSARAWEEGAATVPAKGAHYSGSAPQVNAI